MDQYHCRRCGNILTRDEDHPCFFHKKFDYMYFLQRPVESDKNSDEENVIRNALSDNNNVSGTANSTVNPDLQQGTNEPKNDQTQVSEGVNDEHISPEGLSESHCKKDKMLIDVKKPTSSKEEDNAVAGPSGMCSRQKKFPCSLCPKEFKKEAYLVKHYRMHTGETPHVCDICGKRCNKKSQLITHYRTHTGDKPFVCDVCNRGFALKSNLKVHVRTHTGEKPYKCPACEKSFTNSSDCKRHHKKKHG
ncbi:zinc finger protein 182-like [Argiope bruennichi]|uniref:zinc finger protein 182-like n=1 Tax=Argiope bruennichi TaxID=94029 RepID=UPI002494FC68|nr:zinc finger protein 182-like [Argiope bruennichi]